MGRESVSHFPPRTAALSGGGGRPANMERGCGFQPQAPGKSVRKAGPARLRPPPSWAWPQEASRALLPVSTASGHVWV